MSDFKDHPTRVLSFLFKNPRHEALARQGLVVLCTVIVCYFLFASSTPTPPSPSASAPAPAPSLADDRSADAASLRQANERLRIQMEALEDQNAKLKELISPNKPLSAEQRKMKVVSRKPESFNDEDKIVWVGHRLGSFDFHNFKFEDNSTDRRFWFKTANNEEGHHLYRRLLIQNGWIESTNPKDPHVIFQFYGRYVPKLTDSFGIFTEGRNLINHIPGEYQVLNKEPWLHFIRNYSRALECDYTVMHPESYLVHVPSECELMFKFGDPYAINPFLVRGKETSQEARDNTYWFWKPPGASFGRGIKISSLKTIRDTFGFGEKLLASLPDDWTQEQADSAVRERCKQLSEQLKQEKQPLLIQRAVHPPFLMKGTKFDFRCYLLITNSKPYTVYFKFGHVRRCLLPYDINSATKKVHVCNDYSDAMDQQGDKFPLDDHIWSYDKFRDFLIDEMGYNNVEIEKGFVANLKRLFLGIFKTFKDVFPQKNGYWLLNGLDIAVDSNWNVYALEINANPSLHYNTKVWGKDIVQRNFRLVGEALELALDAQAKTRLGRPLTHRDLIMKTKGGFELIYSEQVSPPYQADDSVCFEQSPLLSHPPKSAAQQIQTPPVDSPVRRAAPQPQPRANPSSAGGRPKKGKLLRKKQD